MANRFFTPYEQFSDSTGLPYANGNLYFYASGTSTPLTTYSDRALTIPNANPVPLDASGKPATAIFLQNLAYKVVLQDANSNPVWTADPVYSSDFSTVAQFQSISGSPNGVLAGSAGSATIPASSCWDYTNNILYVCTQTGTSSTAVWTAVNAATAAAVVPAPQGYLTLTSGTPVIPSDVTAASTVYYTPYVGNIVPIYNGTSFTPTAFTEVQCSLVAAHTGSNIFDFFIFNNSGVVTLVTGPAWTSATAGSSARGSGAGTTQLTKINGIWVNAVSITGRNGSTTYTVPANQATYVGSMYVDTTNGQVSCYRSYGQTRKWGIWNAYNRVPMIMRMGDNTASWSVGSSTGWRNSRGDANNYVVTFTGLAEEMYDIRFLQGVYGTAGVLALYGVGFNSSSSPVGIRWQASMGANDNAQFNVRGTATYIAPPSLGVNVVYSLENTTAATINWGGTEQYMLMTVQYRA